MDFLVINKEELSALSGLPHIQRLVYLIGIRPYMDLKTQIVGIKRKISHQSIAEELYVEPHQGIKTANWSRMQIRRALSGLERAGLITVQSEIRQLILKCPFASRDYFVQNKADTNPTQQPDPLKKSEYLENKGLCHPNQEKPDTSQTPKADIPLNNNYLYIFLLQQFEKFWTLYPEKKSKHKTWNVFQALNPDESLCQKILKALQAQLKFYQQRKQSGHWMAPWKYPANWLSQRAWEDELDRDSYKEMLDEKFTPTQRHRTNSRRTADDFLWESCKAGLEDEFAAESATESEGSNIIAFAQHQK